MSAVISNQDVMYVYRLLLHITGARKYKIGIAAEHTLTARSILKSTELKAVLKSKSTIKIPYHKLTVALCYP